MPSIAIYKGKQIEKERNSTNKTQTKTSVITNSLIMNDLLDNKPLTFSKRVIKIVPRGTLETATKLIFSLIQEQQFSSQQFARLVQ